MTLIRRPLFACGLCLAATALAGAASAQTPPPAPPAPLRSYDVSFGGTWNAPVGLGETSLEYLDSNGGVFTVFNAANGFGNGFGLDVDLGFRLSRRLWAEGIGAWTHVPLQVKITDDVEAGEDVTVSESAWRFALGGAVRLVLSDRGATEWFLRGGASWMREVAADSALTADGTLVDAGVGFIRALSRRSTGALRMVGLRVEGRLSFRSGGLSLGEDKLRAGPVVAGALTLGFR